MSTASRALRTGWFLGVSSLSTALNSTLAVAAGLRGAPRERYDRIHRNWSRTALRAAGVELEVRGAGTVPPDEARIFVANHQSWFDIWGLMAATPASLRFVAKEELSRIPVFAQACRAAGHVFIDRGSRRAAMAAIRQAEERMRREGLSLLLFPEGTRSPNGSLRRFKRGAFELAVETGIPVVPVAVQGGGRIMPKGSRLIRPGRLRLRYAPAEPTSGLGREDVDALTRHCREVIGRMLEELKTPPLSAPGRRDSLGAGAAESDLRARVRERDASDGGEEGRADGGDR